MEYAVGVIIILFLKGVFNMEKINLNLTVSVDLAMSILNLMKQNEVSKDIGNLEDYAPMVQEPSKPPVEVSGVTLDDIRHAFVELAQSKGKDVAKQVIASLGYKRVTEIPQEMFAKALEKVKEAL